MILVNGEETDLISTSDRGLQYGDGLWETIYVSNGKPRLLSQHFERLKLGANKLGFPKINFHELEDEVNKISSLHVNNKNIIKVIITRGASARGFKARPDSVCNRIVSNHPFPDNILEKRLKGISLKVCNTKLAENPNFSGFKQLNMLDYVLAANELDSNFDEGIVCNQRNEIIEGTMSNLFVLDENNTVITPDLSRSGIKGIMKNHLVHAMEQSGILVKERKILLSEIKQMKSVFMTNSIIGLWPVKRINEFQLKGFEIESQPDLHPVINQLNTYLNETYY